MISIHSIGLLLADVKGGLASYINGFVLYYKKAMKKYLLQHNIPEEQIISLTARAIKQQRLLKTTQ